MWVWPLRNCAPMFPDEPGLFGAVRRHDIHTGVDLYAEKGTEVVAVEAGVVVLVEGFTGPNASDPSPWWNDTQAVLIEGASGVVTYGEIDARVELGQQVGAGQLVGVIEQSVLRNYKGRPMTMLHIEWQRQGMRTSPWWRLDEDQPDGLLDVAPKLLDAAGPNPQHFDLESYDGRSFR